MALPYGMFPSVEARLLAHQSTDIQKPSGEVCPACVWPSLYYDALKALITQALDLVTDPMNSPTAVHFVEFGVGFGYVVRAIYSDGALHSRGIAYVGIDPFVPGSDSAHMNAEVRFLMNESDDDAEQWNQLYDFVSTMSSGYIGQSASVVRASTETYWQAAANSMGGIPTMAATLELVGSAFCVFVDGGHSATQVYHDLANAWLLLAPGGIVCGDDYDSAEHMAGVRSGVSQFMALFEVGGGYEVYAYSNVTLQFVEAAPGYRLFYVQKPLSITPPPPPGP